LKFLVGNLQLSAKMHLSTPPPPSATFFAHDASDRLGLHL